MNKYGLKKADPARFDFPQVNVGLIGYGFMGKAHTAAYKKLSYFAWPPVAIPKLHALCGPLGYEAETEEAAYRFGFNGYYNDWEQMVNDPDIDLVDNCTPDDMHFKPSLSAIKQGKHVLCEKPLAMRVEDAKMMYETASRSNAKHMLGHNYRFIPAVRLAKEIIENGMIGTVYEFRGRYLQSAGASPDTPLEDVWYASGTRSGVNLGIGCHIIDLARFLVSEIQTVSAIQKTFMRSRPNKEDAKTEVHADESNLSLVEFTNGAIGSIASSGIASGRLNQHTWEINGSKGSMHWDLEDLNHLYLWTKNDSLKGISGFSKISVTDPASPFASLLWPPGHNIGWENGHLNEIHHLMDCIVHDKSIAPYGATFYDGYVIQLIMDAVRESSLAGKKIEINP